MLLSYKFLRYEDDIKLYYSGCSKYTKKNLENIKYLEEEMKRFKIHCFLTVKFFNEQLTLSK